MSDRTLARIVQCMKWAAALAVDRSLEVRDLLDRGERISLDAVPGPRADGRVGPWPDHLLEAGVEVLASLLEALFHDLTAPRVVEIDCPRCPGGKVQIQAERASEELGWRHSLPPCDLFTAVTTGIGPREPRRLLHDLAIIYRRRCLERARLVAPTKHVQSDEAEGDPG